jgi:CRP/FNR family cyclic AMP-dependent transcriptional regulator
VGSYLAGGTNPEEHGLKRASGMEGALWYLKRCDLFDSLTDEQADHLNRSALVRTFRKRAIIYSPSEPGESVMVLARGRIKIKDITAEGKEAILTFIEEGELFGELALLDGGARQEYAEAVEDSRILVLPRREVLWLMEQRADVALSITKLIGLRRRRIENRLRNVLFLGSKQRMLRLLEELADNYGERVASQAGSPPGGGPLCEIRLSLSHQDLAGLVGLTRETVTVVLGQLQAEGLVKVHRRRITVLNYKRLLQESNSSGQAGEDRPSLPVSAPDTSAQV